MSMALAPEDIEVTLWQQVVEEVDMLVASQSAIAPVARQYVARCRDYQEALARMLTHTLSSDYTVQINLHRLVQVALQADMGIARQSMEDLQIALERDPACQSLIEVFLFYKGFRVLQAYRVAHYYWRTGQKSLARMLQSVLSDKFAMDIHPGARLEGGIFIDHGTGLTIGETACVKRNVSILHDVTLGGTGKRSADRHPKIEEGVMIGAGAKVLGNIIVGRNAKIAAGSIVLDHVAPEVTVVGIPARVVSRHAGRVPASDMVQELNELK